MYLPEHFAESDEQTLLAHIDRHPFATLVSVADGTPFASALPLLLDRNEHALYGHFAGANPHATSLFEAGECVAIFHGPHAYVSPRWYVNPNVPTWNYTLVQARGRAERLDKAALRRLLERLTARFEDPVDPWSLAELPERQVAAMLRAIVGFRLPIATLQGKYKLGQNRTPEDVRGAAQALAERGDHDTAALMLAALDAE